MIGRFRAKGTAERRRREPCTNAAVAHSCMKTPSQATRKMAKTTDGQRLEVQLACKILNTMTD